MSSNKCAKIVINFKLIILVLEDLYTLRRIYETYSPFVNSGGRKIKIISKRDSYTNTYVYTRAHSSKEQNRKGKKNRV